MTTIDEPTPDLSPLAAYLREFRVAAGSPSTRAIARETGISRQGVHQILTGRAIPRPDNLVRLVEYFNADLATARRFAADSRPAKGVPLVARPGVRELCGEITRLRDAVQDLTTTIRERC